MKNAWNPSRREFLEKMIWAGSALVIGGVKLSAQSPAVPQTKKPMKIGIIGSGRQGGSLGLNWARAGHQVFFSSRHPDELKDLVAQAGPRAQAGTPEEAAKFGEVMLIAVPYKALPQVGKDYALLIKGKVVIDCGNPYVERDGPMATDALARGAGVTSAEYLPGVKLVRAFNAIGWQQVRDRARRDGEKIAIPIAADDPAAIRVAEQLVEDAGFDPVVVGGLKTAKEFDHGSAVYVKSLTARELREALHLPQK
jgi:8-hydroxy-5-deazaflavin:NADPH oxidoreductase